MTWEPEKALTVFVNTEEERKILCHIVHIAAEEYPMICLSARDAVHLLTMK